MLSGRTRPWCLRAPHLSASIGRPTEGSWATPCSTSAFPLSHHGLISSRRVPCGPHLPVPPAPQRLVAPGAGSTLLTVSQGWLRCESRRYLPLLYGTACCCAQCAILFTPLQSSPGMSRKQDKPLPAPPPPQRDPPPPPERPPPIPPESRHSWFPSSSSAASGAALESQKKSDILCPKDNHLDAPLGHSHLNGRPLSCPSGGFGRLPHRTDGGGTSESPKVGREHELQTVAVNIQYTRHTEK